MAGKSW